MTDMWDGDFHGDDLCDMFENGSDEAQDFMGDSDSGLSATELAFALGYAEMIADENSNKELDGAEYIKDDDEETHRKAELAQPWFGTYSHRHAP